MTEGEWVRNSANHLERTLTSADADHWWWLAIAPALALVLAAGAFLWRGPRRAGLATLASLVILLAFMQIHASWRLVYLEGDVPKDMLVYTQTSPDVPMMMNDIDRMSDRVDRRQGSRDLVRQRRFLADAVVSPGLPEQALLRRRTHLSAGRRADRARLQQNKGEAEQYLDIYTPQEYVLRWWYPG